MLTPVYWWGSRRRGASGCPARRQPCLGGSSCAASAAVSKAIEEARSVGAKSLKEAVLRVPRGASEDATDRVIALSHQGLQASRTVDDAVRQYLSESGGTTELRGPVVRAANRAV